MGVSPLDIRTDCSFYITFAALLLHEKLSVVPVPMELF